MIFEKILYNKKITMSIPEYLAYERGEVSLKDIYYNQRLDHMAKVINSSKYKMFFVFLLACGLLFASTVPAFAATANVAKIDNAGRTLLYILRTVGYWVCILLAIKDILGALIEGNTKKIGSIVILYVAAFGALYALPWVFDMIKEILV